MAIRPHGAGWQIRFQYRGATVSRTVRGSKTEAQQTERALRARVERGQSGNDHRHTIDDALTTWLTGAALALQDPDDAKAKARHWLPWAERSLQEAPAVAAEATRTWLNAGLAIATINRRLAALRRALNVGFNDGWITDPIGMKIKCLAGERPRMVQANVGQVENLLQHCKKSRVRDAIILAVHTGLRQSEELGLDPVRHYEPAAKGPGRIVLDAKTKTGKPRVIPLTPQADAIARTLPLGLSYNELRMGFEEARAAAGMPWLQWRDLRRTFGSWIVQETGNLKAAQDLLGHTTPAITARHYAHLLDRHLAAATSTLPRMKIKKKTGQKLASTSAANRKKAA